MARAGPSNPAPPPASASTVNTASLFYFYGDSLTAGGQNTANPSYNYPSQFQLKSGIGTVNLGIGGQTSSQICARQGGCATTLTVASNQLVSGSNSVTAINGASIVSMTSNPAAVQMLSTQSDDTTRTITGTLCGLHGTLQRTASGGPPSTTETYTFTPDGTPSTTSCAAASAFTVDNHWSSPQLIWVGRNNYSSASQVKADIASMVAALTGAGNNNYLILGVPNGEYASEYAGQTSYTTITGINTYLSGLYGAHFIDPRAYLVSLATSNGMDQADATNGVWPFTLRAVDGSGTLNGALGTGGACPTLTGTAPAQGQVVSVDSEYIIVLTASGQTVSTCTRGAGGTTQASHSSGAAYSTTDPIHLNTGYVNVAALAYASLAQLQQSNQGYLTTANIGQVVTQAVQPSQPLVAPAGSATNAGLTFAGAGAGTGFFSNGLNNVQYTANYQARWTFGSSITGNTTGAAIANTGVSGTVPTIQPRSSDTASGLGSSATATVDLIANSVSMIHATSTALTLGSSTYQSCTALTTNSSGVLGCTASDPRLKDILGDFAPPADAIGDIVKAGGPILFRGKPGNAEAVDTRLQAGFNCAVVRAYLPAATHVDGKGYCNLDPTAMLAAAYATIADDETRIGRLERRVYGRPHRRPHHH